MILVDTNMLLAQLQFNTDIVKQLKREDKEIALVMPVLEELEKLAIGQDTAAVAARVAIEIVAKEKLRIIEVELKNVDNAILEYAKLMMSDGMHVAVATNDRVLIGKLKMAGIPVYRLRQKKLIERI